MIATAEKRRLKFARQSDSFAYFATCMHVADRSIGRGSSIRSRDLACFSRRRFLFPVFPLGRNEEEEGRGGW